MKKLSTKLAAFLLVAIMVVSLFPASVFAGDEDAGSNDVSFTQEVSGENVTAESEDPTEVTNPDAEEPTAPVVEETETPAVEEPKAPAEEPEAPTEEPTTPVVEEPVVPEEPEVVEEPVLVENTIIRQPQDVIVAPNKKAVFEVEAYGNVSSYKWQYSTNGGRTWRDYGSKKSSISITGTKSWFSSNSGYQYRCIVTFKVDKKKTIQVCSDAATLTVGTFAVQKFKAAEIKNESTQAGIEEVNDMNAQLPKGTTPAVADVDVDDDIMESINSVLPDVVAEDVTAIDISFEYEGKEVEPVDQLPVGITLRSDAIKEGMQLIHICDNGDVEIIPFEIVEDGVIKFESNAFSVYAVVEPGSTDPEARATLNFYGENTSSPIATFYVKNADLTDDTALSQIVYDPGVDELGSGEIFKGWNISTKNTTDGLNYGSNTEAKTIDDIRTFLKTLTIAEGDVYNIYAMIFQAYNVQFKDEDGAMVHGETLINKSGEAVSYTIKTDYTPKTEDQQFQGWYATTTTTDGITPVQDKYQVGDTVSIKGDVIFTPDAPQGNWLVFNSNLGTDTDNKASYTPPQFIKTGQTGTQPTAPTRVGYTFGGWYADPECTTTFNFNTVITTRTTVYAKWTEVATAKYTVIIWKQRVTDDKNAAEADKTYDVWEVIPLTGTTNSAITSVTQNGDPVNTGRTNPAQTRNILVNGTEYSQTGFHCARYDAGKTIKANGTTVVNVYYDRNLITITFNAGSTGGWFSQTRYIYNSISNRYVNTMTFSGLFDAPLEFNWPSQYWTNANGTGTATNNLWTHGSNNGGGTLTFYGSYKLSYPNTVSETLTLTSAGNGTIRFYQQNIDGSWPDANGYHEIIYSSTNNFTLRNKYAGFTVYQYKGGAYSNTGWNTASVNQVVDGSNSQLNIRFSRNKYPINFLDGTYFNGDGVTMREATGTSLKTSDDIYYQASTASYNKGGADYYEPPASVAGYIFSGWYIDKTCTVPYTFNTMPEGGITVYAKWVAVQYRIFLHANVDPSDASLDWGGQSMCFRVDEDEKLANGNKIIGTRDEYELVGWYFDEACTIPFNFDAYAINGELSYLEDYDQTESTEYNKWSRPTSNTNSDAANNRVWITKKLNLYAKWRSTMKGSMGIQIIYDALEGTNSANDEQVYKDSLYYLDSSKAIAQPAATPTDNTLHFVGWIVQKWNDGAWVDTVKVSPGDSFEVLKANALKETNPDWDNVTENQQYLYTIKVVAEYGPKDTPTPTHITWYDNYTTNPVEGANYITDNDLQINAAVDIEPATLFTRPGYKFLGWARVDTTNAQGVPISGYTLSPRNLTAEDLYLIYDAATGSFKLADERYPYHDMYAVWEEQFFYIYHSSDRTVEAVSLTGLEEGKYDITSCVRDGYLYGGYYSDYAKKGNYDVTKPQEYSSAVEGSATYEGGLGPWKSANAYGESLINGNEGGIGTAMTPVANHTYFLKEVPAGYLSVKIYLIYDAHNNNTVVQNYLISVVDDNNYSDISLYAKDITTGSRIKLATQFTINDTYNGKTDKINATTFGKKGFVAVWNPSLATQDFEFAASYTTPDGVTVEGAYIRQVKIGDGTYKGSFEANNGGFEFSDIANGRIVTPGQILKETN